MLHTTIAALGPLTFEMASLFLIPFRHDWRAEKASQSMLESANMNVRSNKKAIAILPASHLSYIMMNALSTLPWTVRSFRTQSLETKYFTFW